MQKENLPDSECWGKARTAITINRHTTAWATTGVNESSIDTR